MFEVLFLIALVMVLFVALFAYNFSKEGRVVAEQQLKIVFIKDKLSIAEKKFFQGKIKKPVFDELLDDLEIELANAELVLFRIKKSREISVEEKTVQILDNATSPARHRKMKISKLLFQAELLKSEIALLESKLMKRELKESVFRKLVKDKENEMIANESELIGEIRKSKPIPTEQSEKSF
ncbi:MAG: hypothetical protein AABW59_01045 [archaeon]